MELPSFDTALRILALHASHDKKDWETAYRRVCRWYSKTFHTPLHQVLDLDEVFVLQHYYESSYEALDDDEWRQEVREAIETPAEKVAREQREALEDKGLLARAAAASEKQRQKVKRGPQSMGEAAETAQRDFETIADKLKAALDGLPANIAPAQKVGDKVKTVEPDQISMPGFAADAFVRLSEDEKAPVDDMAMGLAEPRPWK